MDAQMVKDVAAFVERSRFVPNLPSDLRLNWPDVHFTVCSDDDVCGPNPVFESKEFNIYLVDGHDHCLAFTSQIEAATGLVVAEVEVDEIAGGAL